MQTIELIANIESNLSDWCWEQRDQPEDIQDVDCIAEVEQVTKELLALWVSGKKEISYQEYQELWAVDPHEIFESAWTQGD